MVPLDTPLLGYFALDTILRALRPSPAPLSPATGVPPTTVIAIAAATSVFTALAAFALHKLLSDKSPDPAGYASLSDVAAKR